MLHKDGSAALFVSACNGHIEVVSKLLEEGIDVNATLEVSVNTSTWFLFICMFSILVLLYRLYRIPYTVHYVYYNNFYSALHFFSPDSLILATIVL